ncbi:MAG: acyl-CoA dehydrogenase family protein [Woeseiaceae bacterium]
MDAEVLPTVEDLLTQVEALEPLILEEKDEAERIGRMSDKLADKLRENAFFRMFRPQSRNGLGFDPVSGFRVVEALTKIDSSVGWNVAISNATETFAPWFSDEATEEIFGSPNTVCAGGVFPPRAAIPVEGGYRVSGKSLFNSNCHAANWILVEALIYDGDELRLDAEANPQGLFMYVPANEATIVENWDTMGMRGTGSHDVLLDDVFVPEHRAAPLDPIETFKPAYDNAMSRLAIWPAVCINGLPALGIAQSAIDDFVDMAANKIPAFTETSLRDRPLIQLRLAQAEGKVKAARSLIYNTFDQLYERTSEGHVLTIEERADCQQAASHATMASAEAVELIHSLVGSAGLRKDQPFERHLRDINVITQHAFVCESRLQTVGEVRLGLDPSWPFMWL